MEAVTSATAPVATGLDVLREQGFASLRGQRVGLLCHPASVDGELRHAAALLHAAPAVDLRALFGPQHGLRGETQDNMVEWEGFRDAATGLPVFSLYGEHRRPTAAMLEGIDTLVVDLQDVGARYYTFVWTLLLCLDACAAAGKRVVVLDRPNPIGGVEREGALLEPAHASFVGLAPLPMRHGLTLGELALWLWRWRAGPGAAHEWRAARGDAPTAPMRSPAPPPAPTLPPTSPPPPPPSPLDLEVVPMRGWRRAMPFDATGLPWVLPSPNMPTQDTALVYPGMCLLEGTELSEGRGTTRPFEIFGAPGVDPDALVARLDGWRLPGAAFRPLHFQPTFQKHAGRLCGGAQIHVRDRAAFRPCLTAVAVLAAVRDTAPAALRWREPPYEYETVKRPFDILAGGPRLRERLEAGRAPADIAAEWDEGVAAFTAGLGECLLYD